MFFVVRKRDGKTECYKTARNAACYMLGRETGKYDIYVAGAPVQIADPEMSKIVRVLEESAAQNDAPHY